MLCLGSCVLGSFQRRTVLLGAHSKAPKPFAQFFILRAWESGTLGRNTLPPPLGGTIALSSQVRYPRPPKSQGRTLGVAVEPLAQWPPSPPGLAGQVPPQRAHQARQPAFASMRSASRGLQIAGARGARPAPPAVPAPGARRTRLWFA